MCGAWRAPRSASLAAARPTPRAAPAARVLERGVGREGRKLIVATEYVGLTKAWLARKGVEATVLRSYGATESLPPEDADLIVDNAATGATLKANALDIFDVLMHSTTRLYASAAAWAAPAKRARIEELALLLRAVLDARKRLMVSFNAPAAALEALVASLPCLRAPTVSPLHSGAGFAVAVAALAEEVPALIPRIKAAGGSDIVVSNIKMLIA